MIVEWYIALIYLIVLCFFIMVYIGALSQNQNQQLLLYSYQEYVYDLKKGRKFEDKEQFEIEQYLNYYDYELRRDGVKK